MIGHGSMGKNFGVVQWDSIPDILVSGGESSRRKSFFNLVD
jgi:hypothetical protein